MATLKSDSRIRKVFPTARQLLLEADLDCFLPTCASKVLVVGAGCDPYRKRFSNPELYIAVDIVFHSGATDIIADALKLPFERDSFDCVIATEVAEHVKNPLLLYNEAHRVLAPGGKLLMSVPFGFHQHADPMDYSRPTFWSLKVAMDIFRSVEVWPQGNRLHVLSDLITTAFFPRPLFVPLRIFNHLLVWRSRRRRKNLSSFPSGHFVVAEK